MGVVRTGYGSKGKTVSETSDVTMVVEGAVALIQLNRPAKLNAITPEMSNALKTFARQIDDEREIRVVILLAAGERSFCAGSDISELDAYPDAWTFRNRADYCDAVRSIRKPVIAAINGYAYGGGLELAMSCDIRIASRNATFAAPEIKLGWVGGGGQAAFLAHSAGPSNASLMLLTGDAIDAERALAFGLVSEVVELGELGSRVRALAETIAARPPIAVETAKLNVRNAFSMSLESCIQYERDLQTVCFGSEDAAEGRSAFKEKRQANFQGR